MKYLCLVYLDEKRLDELPDEDCVAYDTAIRASGQCLASEALESVQTATTVRIDQSHAEPPQNMVFREAQRLTNPPSTPMRLFLFGDKGIVYGSVESADRPLW